MENLRCHTQVLLIRTKLNKKHGGRGVLRFLTDVARDTVSSIVNALLTPSLMKMKTGFFGTGEHSTRGRVSRIILSRDAVPFISAGILQNFANKIRDKDWLLFIRVNQLKNDSAACPHEYLVNSYCKC